MTCTYIKYYVQISVGSLGHQHNHWVLQYAAVIDYATVQLHCVFDGVPVSSNKAVFRLENQLFLCSLSHGNMNTFL